MKNSIMILTVLILTISLTGCATNALPNTMSTDETSSALSASELAAGTMELQGTDEFVTTEQATKLLTLWLAYQEVNTRDTSSELETQALVNQITSAMTTEQIEAIQAMNLSTLEMQSLTGGTSTIQADSETTGSQEMPGNVPADGGMMGAEIGAGEMKASGMEPIIDSAAPTSSSQNNLTLSLVEPLIALLKAQTA